jgi:glycosyltransferase involved in cell wall biosynthesis
MTSHLAVLAPVPEPTLSRENWGGQVVTLAFLEALLRHAPLDRITFFTAEPAVSQQRLERWRGRWVGIERVRVASYEALETILRDDPPVALHALGNYLHEAAYARSLLADARFPVTGSAFGSPSFHTALPHHGQDLVCGLRPGDTMVCISDAARQFYAQLFDHLRETAWSSWQGPLRGPELTVIPHGIDLEAFRPGRHPLWRQRLQIPADGFAALSLCRLSPADKMDLVPVLLGFRRWLDRQEPQAPVPYLVLAGSDYAGYGSFLQQTVGQLGLQPWVRLVADPPEAEKLPLLQAADCFIALPDNPQEAFGYSVLEAMACGLPVIGADWDGLKETIAPEVGVRVPTVWGPALAGLDRLSPLYRSGEFTAMHLVAAQSVAVDVDAAFDALGRWAAEPDGARRMGLAARQRAEAVYDWRTIVGHYVRMWAAAHAVAETQPAPTAGQQWATAFDRAFRHYPTHWLADEACVRRRATAKVGPDKPVYAGLADRFDTALLGGILAASTAATPIADLRLRFPDEAPTRLTSHVLWLLKYGWLEWV